MPFTSSRSGRGVKARSGLRWRFALRLRPARAGPDAARTQMRHVGHFNAGRGVEQQFAARAFPVGQNFGRVFIQLAVESQQFELVDGVVKLVLGENVDRAVGDDDGALDARPIDSAASIPAARR